LVGLPPCAINHACGIVRTEILAILIGHHYPFEFAVG